MNRELPSEIIAENACTNPARVRKVLHKLKAAWHVAFQNGAESGYIFIADADRTTLFDILTRSEANSSKPRGVRATRGWFCPIAAGIAPIMDDMFSQLDDCCRATLSARTLTEIDKKLFSAKRKGKKHDEERSF